MLYSNSIIRTSKVLLSAGYGVYEPGTFPLGPFRSEGNTGTLTSGSALNCRGFNENCKWSNTNEDELDWKVRSTAPESEAYLHVLNTAILPEQTSAVLFSAGGNGWEVGQLVSDQLPCMTSPLQLTATVWRTASPGSHEQPNLRVCSRNLHSEFAASNCNQFPAQNGVPATVNVPIPHDPLSPTQIVLMGDNFAAGGAIFLQDIFVEGQLERDCAMAALDNRVDIVDSTQWKESDAYSGTGSVVVPSYMQRFTTPFPSRNLARMPNLINEANYDPFYETCAALSCNPAESECKWYAGRRGWITAVAERFSNPLTGVQLPPPGIRGFLVAPFTNDVETTYQMISPTVTILPSSLATYFCFYEFFAIDGARLSVCADKAGHNCFYTRTEIEIEDFERTDTNRKWRYRCAKMPTGTYEVSVVAENKGTNKGDIGFVPVIVTHDLHKKSGLCEREARLKRQ